MNCLKKRHPLKSLLHCVVSCYTVIFILLMNTGSGWSQEVGSSQTITAVIGTDVILPCHLEPAVDVVSKSLEWGRLDLEPRFVHVWHEGQNLLDNQNPSYRGRTSLSTDKLKHGDLSLTLSAVKHSDNGRYRCYFPSESKTSFVELVVGSVSSPVIAGININHKELLLQCESRGWYPEPEVLWLDSEGNLLSAGPTETVRGSDDLYALSSRVTVEKGHRNNITCKVQQNQINQNRETQIEVTAECFADSSVASCSSLRLSIILIVLLGFICVAVLCLWKGRQHINKEIKKLQLLIDDKKTKELEKKEEERKLLEEVLSMLTVERNELKKLTDELTSQNKDMDREYENTDRKLQSVEMESQSDREKGFIELKEIILESKQQLVKRKQEHEQLELKTQTLLNKTDKVIREITEKKTEVEKHKVEIS